MILADAARIRGSARSGVLPGSAQMKILSRKTLAATAVAGAIVLTTMSATTASAGAAAGLSAKRATTLTTTPILPFQIAFRGSTLHYTDGFTGTIHKITPSGEVEVASAPGGIDGVEFSQDGKTMAFAGGSEKGGLLTLRRAGHPDVVADLGQYEQTVNPDRNITYGITKGGNQCARDFLSAASGLPATYKGAKDSHAYQVAALPHGAFAVAEAGGNAILKVTAKGVISVLSLLPRQPHKFTAAEAQALDAPSCIVGVTYAFEAVPTDVEVGKNGRLWVTTLAGGPEGPQLGARGKVYTIERWGKATQFAKGLLGATNLAVASSGKIYVTELFNGRVAAVSKTGHVSTAIPIKGSPVSVEVKDGHIYVGLLGDVNFETGEVKSPGKIYRF